MKTVKTNWEQEYKSPSLEVTEMVTEGILCASGLESPNSIPDLEEDFLNW